MLIHFPFSVWKYVNSSGKVLSYLPFSVWEDMKVQERYVELSSFLRVGRCESFRQCTQWTIVSIIHLFILLCV